MTSDPHAFDMPWSLAELFFADGYWRWRIVMKSGVEYVDGGNFRTREDANQDFQLALLAMLDS